MNSGNTKLESEEAYESRIRQISIRWELCSKYMNGSFRGCLFSPLAYFVTENLKRYILMKTEGGPILSNPRTTRSRSRCGFSLSDPATNLSSASQCVKGSLDSTNVSHMSEPLKIGKYVKNQRTQYGMQVSVEHDVHQLAVNSSNGSLPLLPLPSVALKHLGRPFMLGDRSSVSWTPKVDTSYLMCLPPWVASQQKPHTSPAMSAVLE